MKEHLKIVSVHNYYQQPGGEDNVFAAEAELLESRGHQVVRQRYHNEDISRMNLAAVAIGAVWNQPAALRLRALFRDEAPDIVHFHNTFPLVSPVAYAAAVAEGIPVVQTLHNYRLLCANATLYRAGRPCEKCIGKTFGWPAFVHACYRDSAAASGVVAAMQSAHRFLGTWSQNVDRYIALTEFAKSKFELGGLPADRIAVKPNFVADTDVPTAEEGARGGALFVGRLSEEKGVAVLTTAWRRLDLPLRIVGDGPERDALYQNASSHVAIIGPKPHRDVIAEMSRAAFLVLPSVWYETFGLVAIEAFSMGLPVIASRLGAMAEIVEEGVTGLLFTPGDADDLADTVRWAQEHPEEMRRMGRNARRVYEEKYTPEANYRMLMAIYRDVMTQSQSRRSNSTSTGRVPLTGEVQRIHGPSNYESIG